LNRQTPRVALRAEGLYPSKTFRRRRRSAIRGDGRKGPDGGGSDGLNWFAPTALGAMIAVALITPSKE